MYTYDCRLKTQNSIAARSKGELGMKAISVTMINFAVNNPLLLHFVLVSQETKSSQWNILFMKQSPRNCCYCFHIEWRVRPRSILTYQHSSTYFTREAAIVIDKTWSNFWSGLDKEINKVIFDLHTACTQIFEWLSILHNQIFLMGQKTNMFY